MDIPKICDFFAEIVGPIVIGGSLSLSLYGRLLIKATLGRKAAIAISRYAYAHLVQVLNIYLVVLFVIVCLLVYSRTLKECLRYVDREKVCHLWDRSGLRWTKLGLNDYEVEEFLKYEVLTISEFCLVSSSFFCAYMCILPTFLSRTSLFSHKYHHLP